MARNFPPRRIATQASQRKHRCPTSGILLADDNRDAAESLAIILRLEGHR
jgi:hypothetical protein